MINSLRFRNFKALRRLDLGLERLTLLVGPNGSGKTSVLEGLSHLTRLASTDPREIFAGPTAVGLLATRGASGQLELGLAGSFRARRGSLAITFPAIEDYPFTSAYILESHWGERHRSIRRDLHAEVEAAGALSPAELPLAPALGEAMFLRFDPQRLAAPSLRRSAGEAPLELGMDGSNLAAVLADLAASRPDDFRRIEGAVRAVIRGLNRVRVVRIGRSDTLVFDMIGAGDLPAHAASEGTLRLLGLFTALLTVSSSRMVLIDPIDRAVGPRAVGALMREIHAILAADPRLQIVATTDSPQLLDEVTAEEVRVHTVREDGAALVVPLASHPDFALLRDDLRPGELWTATGDAWVPEACRVAERVTLPPPRSPSLPPPASTRGR